jgi:hypothetical protein
MSDFHGLSFSVLTSYAHNVLCIEIEGNNNHTNNGDINTHSYQDCVDCNENRMVGTQ